MTDNEREALLHYVEFLLLSFCEQTEKHVNDADVVNDMYERACHILADLEITLENNSNPFLKTS